MTFCNTPWAFTSNTLSQTEIRHPVSCRVGKLNSRTLGNLAIQPLAKLGSVIGIDLSVEACARDGNVGAAVGQLSATTTLVALFGPKGCWLRFSKPVRQFMRIETDCPSRLPPSGRPSKLVTFIAFSPKIMPV